MLKREIEEATQKLQETKIARSLLKITNNWDPANASSLNGSGEVVRLFFYDYIFRNDLIIYSHLVKVNENYRKINCLSAMALVEDDLMAGDEASDNILRYLDCPDTFYELEKEYIKSNLIRNDRHYRRNLYRKNKQILYGAILLMYHHKIFRPNYELENGNWKRLTEKKAIQILAERYHLKRLDKIKVSKGKLMKMAAERLPVFKEPQNTHDYKG